jgi:hypothetical protein
MLDIIYLFNLQEEQSLLSNGALKAAIYRIKYNKSLLLAIPLETQAVRFGAFCRVNAWVVIYICIVNVIMT